jgi:heat shock protein HslJ
MEKAIAENGSFNTRLRAWEVIAAIGLIGLMALTLLACSSPSGDTVKLEGITWVLKSYGDAANPTQAITGHEPTLTFDKEKMNISGNSGVNSYGGDYTVDGNKLTCSKMMQTLMASTDPALNSQETAFMKILGSVTSFKIESRQLTITSSNGILVFSTK